MWLDSIYLSLVLLYKSGSFTFSPLDCNRTFFPVSIMDLEHCSSKFMQYHRALGKVKCQIKLYEP